jgi:O-methyltransferase
VTHADTPVDLYLELLAKTLTRALFEDNDRIFGIRSTWKPATPAGRAADAMAPVLGRFGLELVRKRPYNRKARTNGRDWPARAETMAGLKRLRNARRCIESVLADGIPGDLIETGVWRGGMSIYMRAVLMAHGVTDRTVWLADSFRGLPPPDVTRFPADEKLDLTGFDILAVGAEQVRRNFARYGLLDDQVQFLVGWFKDTLPTAPIDRIAVLRLDGDLYESTTQALDALYPKLSSGGYCIIDDYGVIRACRSAVSDYRAEHGISDAIKDIDGSGAYWRKS